MSWLIVETNAVAYDDGSLTSDIADEFNVFPLDDPEAGDVRVAIAEVTLASTFQPITDTGNPVISLSAGVWGGLVMLGGGAGVLRRLRRR